MTLKIHAAMRVYVMAMLLLPGWVCPVAAQSAQKSIRLIEPEEDSRFNPGTNILLRAVIGTEQADLRQVEFLADGQLIGVVSNRPYSTTWSNVSAGTYQIMARAIPATGAALESDTVHVRVYNSRLTFGLDRIPLLEKIKFFDIPLWQYCASLLYIFLAFYVSKFLDFLTRVWLKRWATRTATRFDDLLLDLLNGPTKIIAFVIFLRIGLEVFSWPVLVRNFLGKSFTIIVALSLTYTVLKFIDLVMGYWKDRTKAEVDRAFDEQLFPIIRKSLKVFVVVVGVLVTLDNIGVNITAAIASLSIGGLAVGLAAQDTLANLFGAVAVFVDKPFRIGDYIELDGAKGNVESIGLRSTRLRHPDGHLITVPNKTMGNSTITNVTRRPRIKTELNLGLTYETPTEKVRQAVAILQEIYNAHKMTSELLLSFNRFADSSLNISVIHWWEGTDYKAYLAGMQEMNLAIKERFDAEGINFAFPSRTLYVKQDSEWRMSKAEHQETAVPPSN
ncbi:MAG: mechanosensitive ion channel [Akkermansiaceae bacterium]|nr:mechanosensitive ion channel [Verrucomicrobiales bacterium]